MEKAFGAMTGTGCAAANIDGCFCEYNGNSVNYKVCCGAPANCIKQGDACTPNDTCCDGSPCTGGCVPFCQSASVIFCAGWMR